MDAPISWFGKSTSLGEPFTYLRIPADETSKIDTYMRLRAMLLDKSQTSGLAETAVKVAIPAQGAECSLPRRNSGKSVEWALDRFATAAFRNRPPPANQSAADKLRDSCTHLCTP